MTFRLIIDTREKGSVATELNHLNVDYSVEPLSVGDFAIKDEKDNIVALWERKTCADLAASINDGRYGEQKGRLAAENCKWKGYIIEGYYPASGLKVHTKKGLMPRGTIDSVKLSITLKNNFIIYELSDSTHTAEFLKKMLAKITEYSKESGSETEKRETYEDALIKSMSNVRKENMTPDVCFLSQLCQIPGVSYAIAQAIKNVYPNMRAILNLNVKTLSDIKVTNRRLGTVLAERIFNYMGLGEGTNEDLICTPTTSITKPESKSKTVEIDSIKGIEIIKIKPVIKIKEKFKV